MSGRVLAVVVAMAAAGVLAPEAQASPTYRRLSGTTFGPRQVKISGNGRFVAFVANPRPVGLGAPDGTAPVGNARGTDDSAQVYVADRRTGQVELVSVSTTDDVANRDSVNPSISADGRYVVFESLADNLVADDTNSTGVEEYGHDIFVRDRKLRRTERVSLDARGRQLVETKAVVPSISADGSTIAYYVTSNVLQSPAARFNGGGLHQLALVVVPRVRGHARPAWVNPGPDGSPVLELQDEPVEVPAAISATGRFVAAAWRGSVQLRDLKAKVPRVLSPAAFPPALLTDAATGYVAVDANATKVVFEAEVRLTYLGKHRRILLWNTRTGRVGAVDGASLTVDDPTGTVSGRSDPGLVYAFAPAISANGRYVVFGRADTRSKASLLFLGDDQYEFFDTWLYGGGPARPSRLVKVDLANGAVTDVVTCKPVELVPAERCPYWSYSPSISDNGAVTAFATTAPLDPAEPDAQASTAPDPNRVSFPADVYVAS